MVTSDSDWLYMRKDANLIFFIIIIIKNNKQTVTNNNNEKTNKQGKKLNRPTLQTGNSFENYKSLQRQEKNCKWILF